MKTVLGGADVFSVGEAGVIGVLRVSETCYSVLSLYTKVHIQPFFLGLLILLTTRRTRQNGNVMFPSSYALLLISSTGHLATIAIDISLSIAFILSE